MIKPTFLESQIPEFDTTSLESPLVQTIFQSFVDFTHYTNRQIEEKSMNIDSGKKCIYFVRDCVESAPEIVKTNLDDKLMGFFQRRHFIKLWGSGIALPFVFNMAVPYLSFYEENQENKAILDQINESKELVQNYFDSVGLIPLHAKDGIRLFKQYLDQVIIN